MNLKKSIVVVNEFTVKSGKGGSRGGTPGNYVLQYMARDDAVEPIVPIQYDTESPGMRYLRREQALEQASSVSDLKRKMRQQQGDGGVAFGYGEFSLSHKKLQDAADDIQTQFNKGKTVMKTVLSFEEEYLRQRGLVAPQFFLDRKGDYKGNVDQLKLRMAIMHGLDKLQMEYDDLQYIGVIQVDTKHVHCHLAMVDRGVGTLMPDGTQRGKITDRSKQILRQGIDSFLDEKQTVKMMSSNVEYGRRNTVCFVKQFTHKMIDERGFAQFLFTCLPEDKRMWRAGTHAKEMQKANALVREYVEQLWQQPDSGYEEALRNVDRYARSRAGSDDISGAQYRQYYQKGYQRMLEDSMNGVYAVLKQVPDEERTVRTPMLEVMSMPYEEMAVQAKTDPMIDFGFKLRSYKSRLDHHKKERHKYHDAVNEYRRMQSAGDTDETSRPLLDFFEEEEEYNAMLLAKYQYFLKFAPADQSYQEELDRYLAYDKRVQSTERMLKDPSMKRMKAEHAEEYGKRVYEEEGGSYLVTDAFVLEQRLQQMRLQRDRMRREYDFQLADDGLMLDDQTETVKRGSVYAFDDVKALDLHHMVYDFSGNLEVSVVNTNRFLEAADRRYQAFMRAKQYLVSSGQEDTLSSLPEEDIMMQHSMAQRFRTDRHLYSQRPDSVKSYSASKTIRLDCRKYYEQEEDMKNYVKQSIKDLQF